jgi:ADP-heptose:LPS heptosyltransferase
MPASRRSSKQHILVVRRDNIGDLVCTTPLFSALRQRFPDAWIGALVNSYNAPVLQGNPDVDEIFAYRKLKHREPGDSLLSNLWTRYRLIAALRRKRLDYVILAGNAARATVLARILGAKSVVGLAASHMPADVPAEPVEGRHEVEITFRLAQPLGISGPPPAPSVVPDKAAVTRLRRDVATRLPGGAGRLIGIHISARKPSQRWPIERFAELIRAITRHPGAGVLLFWSPGPENDPRHPGDDEKAQTLALELRSLPLFPVPTRGLGELIAGLSLCDRVICSDGGAMHLAAALAKPIVCLFGQSDAARWHPWGVPHALLQPASRDVRDIDVVGVLDALGRLG